MRFISILLVLMISFGALQGCGLKFKKLDKREKVEQDEVDVLINEGNLLFKQEEYKDALAKFLTAKSIDPQRKLVNYNLGATYFALENYSEAARAFTDELLINNADPYSYIFRAHSYAIMGLNDKAMADIELSLQITDHAMSYYVQGLVHLNKNEFQLAVNKFNAAIYKDPSDYLFYRDRGNAYLKLDKIPKACEDFKQAKRINGQLDLSKEMANCEE